MDGAMAEGEVAAIFGSAGVTYVPREES